MAYKLLNKELQIASCSIADLTLEQAQKFLSMWESGATLGALTLFFETHTGLLVLNRDNEEYESYKDLAESYLALGYEERMKILGQAPEGIIETMEILEGCAKSRMAKKEIDRASKNYILGHEHIVVLNKIQEKFYDTTAVVRTSFQYGVMVGKRMERARRKKGTAT